MKDVDILIRGGTVVDGMGGEPFVGDVAIAADRIAGVGDLAEWTADREIEAAGKIVTPGFVDVHTHYDGQAIWSERLTPSSAHGVTTVLLGNCGVGFAPCRAEDRERLVMVMEGVEDIPEIVMTKGLPWDWETFDEYLDALECRRRDINVAAYIPHAALRVYVMGERGAAREPASPRDMEKMAELVRRAIRAGAAGFATANVFGHRTSTGDFTPTYQAAETELLTIAAAVREAGGGIFQILFELQSGEESDYVGLMERLSLASGGPVTFTLAQPDNRPESWKKLLELVERANRKPGVSIIGQVFPRPVGMLLGHHVSLNPFRLCPSYEPLVQLSFEERLAALRTPEMRARLIAEQPAQPKMPLALMTRNFARIFPLGDPPKYEPAPESSVLARAERAGVTPEEIAYDLLLEDDGKAFLLCAIANYPDGNLDATLTMLQHPDCVPGLGDGGAHYGMICDASFPTFMLTHWVRDRQGKRLELSQAIAALTSRPAALMGLADRGRIATGAKADLNVIDLDHLAICAPHVVSDLPAGGRRLDQAAVGYVATIVAGEIILENDQPTGNCPGRVLRSGKRHELAA